MGVTTEQTEQTTAGHRPDLRLVALVMAFACGLTVANIYYCQPLLELIGQSFHVGQGTASLAVTLTQLGYAIGLLFLVPLGDLFENRKLVVRILVGTAISLALLAASPVFGAFLAFSVMVGITSVIVQVLVPLAAHLAPEGETGNFVGKVMSGLLLGILLARSVSSALAQVLDWRVIYVISAVLMVALSVVLRSLLPQRRAEHDLGYGQIMASIVTLAREQPRLRRAAFCQAMMFGAFSCYWTAIAFELIDHHGFSQGSIALFALVGAGGAAAAPVAGRIADRGWGEWTRGGALLLGALSFLLANAGHGSVLWLAVAAVLLDFAVQSHQVMSQHTIYGLVPSARARINTVYMVTIFAGGTVASALAGWVHDSHGWTGVCWLGFALPLCGLAVWAWGRLAELREPARA